MNPVKRDENKSLSATEGDQTTRPEALKDTVVKKTHCGTPVDRSPSHTSQCSDPVKLEQEVSGQEMSFKIQNRNLGKGDVRRFTFSFKESSGKSDRRVFTAWGELNESIYSALRANDNFHETVENLYHKKDVSVYGEKAIEGYVNLGMPLKCLPEDSHFKISVQRKGKQKEYDQVLRRYENPNAECILFHVVAIGKTVKRIVKIKTLHEKGSTLCIYALEGETVQEALCKDGRFRADLDRLAWKLVEGHKNIHGKGSTVEEVAGKVLELDICKKQSQRKQSHRKIEQKNENATGETNPQDVMPSQIQIQKPEEDGESEDGQQDHGNVLPLRSLGHDLEGKKRRTISQIKHHYSTRRYRKCWKRNSLLLHRPLLDMERAVNLAVQRQAADTWLKNFKMLDGFIMQQYPNFSKDARWMRNYFRKEQKKTKLSPSQQFKIYDKCFAKVTKNSTSVATYERRTHLSKSVGFVTWNNNGNSGNATCFVFSDAYIFTCRHVLCSMVGESTHPSLWPGIISKHARVTFSYKTFHPPAEEWFSLEPWFEVCGGALDYAILKLRENGNGFPPGLVGQISSGPPSGLIYLIGHPEGRIKEVDECVVITSQELSERHHQHGLPEVAEGQSEMVGGQSATPGFFSMFSSNTFSPVAQSTNPRMYYDTCFAKGSSGSPVFNAEGKVVAMHSFGQFYERGGKQYAFIEYGYSMESILQDLKQRNGPLHKFLTE